MNPHLFLPYFLAVAVLVLIPGPVVTLVIANSTSWCSRRLARRQNPRRRARASACGWGTTKRAKAYSSA